MNEKILKLAISVLPSLEEYYEFDSRLGALEKRRNELIVELDGAEMDAVTFCLWRKRLDELEREFREVAEIREAARVRSASLMLELEKELTEWVALNEARESLQFLARTSWTLRLDEEISVYFMGERPKIFMWKGDKLWWF